MNTAGMQTIEVAEFWRWLKRHRNCVIQAGGPGFTVFDQQDLFWHLSEEEDGLFVAQVVRGKELSAEIVFNSTDVIFVQSSPDQGEHVVFECIGQTPDGQQVPLLWFLMAHGWDEEVQPQRRWTH